MKKLFSIIILLLLTSPAMAVDYRASASCSDQGSSTTGCAKSIIDAIGSKNATLVFASSSSGTTTSYAVGTSLTIPTNVKVRIDPGAILTVASAKTLTIYTPDNIIAKPKQQLFAGAGAVAFSTAGTVHPGWWSGLTQTALQGAVTAAADGSTVLISGNYTLSADLVITSKNRLRVTGDGTLTLASAAADAMVIKLAGTCDKVTIDGLTLVGENNSAYYQVGIGNLSGHTLSNIAFRNLKISKLNVGLSFNAYLGGTYLGGIAENNVLSEILGVGAGQGYGIHIATASGIHVLGNRIDGVGRHSIYQGAGVNNGNVISGNVITNHRKDVATNTYLPAIAIARSSGVRCDNNILIDFYDGGIHVQHDESTTTSAQNISISNNQLIGRKNVIPGIGIGDPNTGPTLYWTERVDVRGNFVTTDRASVGGYEIRIFNGRQIDISNNTVVMTGVAGAAYAFGIGSNTMDAATDLDYVTASGNAIYATGGDLSAVYGFQFSTELGVLESHVSVTRNTFNAVKDFEHALVTTNKYLVFETGTGGRKGFYAAGDLTPSVYGKNYMVITNGSAKTVTNLDDGEEGQVVRLYFTDGNTTIGHYGTGYFWLAGGANKNMQAGDSLQVMLYDGYWREIAH